MAITEEAPLLVLMVLANHFPVYATLLLFCSMRLVVPPVAVGGVEEGGGVVVGGCVAVGGCGGGAGLDEGTNSTINVSMRAEHPKDVSAPSVPSQ